MNKAILVLDQHEIDGSDVFPERKSYKERRAARAVLKDDEGKVALMHASKRKYYKLPGGGIDEDEDALAALTRELLEETGCSARVVAELGIVEEWRDEDKLHQISYAYQAIKVGKPVELNLTDSELDEGFELVWVHDINEAIKLVENAVDDPDVRVSFMTKRDAAILRSAKV
jgi:8-oxo-dGTP pyrophosphatase MutT (NUDIX family)